MKNLIALVHRLQPILAFQIFTIYLRYLLGGAFIMAAFGMGKISGSAIPIASLDEPIQNLGPVQLFFRVMVESGFYWDFIGWAQLAAGVLLMTHRFAALGAALFFGMMLNIFIITVSYNFTGTPFITGLMLLATIYLLLWEVDKWQFFFIKPSKENLVSPPVLSAIDQPYWIILGFVLIADILFCVFFKLDFLVQLGSCFGVGFVGFVIFLLKRRYLVSVL